MSQDVKKHDVTFWKCFKDEMSEFTVDDAVDIGFGSGLGYLFAGKAGLGLGPALHVAKKFAKAGIKWYARKKEQKQGQEKK